MSELQTYRVILSPDVARQLQTIFDYIHEHSPQNAPRLVEQILVAIESLKIFPRRQIVDGQAQSLHPVRSLPVGNYVIFFRVMETQRAVRVVGVRHGARQRPKRFKL